ncbi:MAG: FAD-binding protein [Spirochaetes bacterium]|nr:FAD-binding protein [Spirochaetota bacterium]
MIEEAVDNRLSIIKSIAERIGEDKLRLDNELLLEYSRDRWAQGISSIAVFFPETTEDVSIIASFLYDNDIAMVPRGSGTGMTGGCIPLDKAVIISFDRMNRILSINKSQMTVTVQSGLILEDMQRAVESEGLFYPPDPASADICSIGGNISENAGGLRCVKYGVTGDYVLELTVVMPDGTVSRFGSHARKDVAGFDLKRLMIGSEGMLAFITEAVLKLIPLPESAISYKIFFRTSQDAVLLLNRIFMIGIIPAKAEFLDISCLNLIAKKFAFKFPEDAGAALLLSLDGSKSEIAEYEKKMKPLIENAVYVESSSGKSQDKIWELRTQISPSLKEIAPIKINEDVSVPIDVLSDLVRFCEDLAAELGLVIAVFGHAGDGNLHVNFMITEEQKDQAKKGVELLFCETVRLGGTITGEHGIGIAKAAYAGIRLDPVVLKVCREIKRVFDPKNLLNSGKVFYGELHERHLTGRII